MKPGNSVEEKTLATGSTTQMPGKRHPSMGKCGRKVRATTLRGRLSRWRGQPENDCGMGKSCGAPYQETGKANSPSGCGRESNHLRQPTTWNVAEEE